MKRSVRWISVVTLSIIFLGCGGASSPKAAPSGVAQSAGAPELTESKPNSDGYSESPFDSSVESLSANYLGNDPVKLYWGLNKLQDNEKKGEFESTKAYQARLRNQRAVPIIGTLRFDSRYAFQVETQQIHVLYNADAGVLQLGIDSGLDILRELPTQPFGVLNGVCVLSACADYFPIYNIVIQNGSQLPPFHFRHDPSSPPYDFIGTLVGTEVRMNPRDAEALKKNVAALCVAELQNPPISEEETNTTPGVVVDKYYLHVRLLEVWFYDFTNGSIIARVRFRPTKHTSPVIRAN